MVQNGIKFKTNNLGLQHDYFLMQLKDYSCPMNNLFKYKGDPMCYPCTLGT